MTVNTQKKDANLAPQNNSNNHNSETIVTHEKPNRFDSFIQFQEFIRDMFITGSGIDPVLFEACIEFHQDLEIDPGNEARYPIHEELGWNYTRFGHQAKEPLYAAFLRNEDGTLWQAIVSIWDEDKQRPYKYYAPNKNGDRAYLPPIPPSIRKKISSRYAVDVPEDGSFWKWLETQEKIPRIITEGGKKSLCGISSGYIVIALYGCHCGVSSNKDENDNKTNPKLIPDLSRFAVEHTIWLLALDRDEKQSTKVTVSFAKKKLTKTLQNDTGKCFCEDIFWRSEQGKGLDDLVVKSGNGSFDGAYNRALDRLEKQFKNSGLIIQDADRIEKKPPVDKISQKIAEEYRQMLRFNNETGRWMRYQADLPGQWSAETDDFAEAIVYQIVKAEGIEGFGANYISSIVKTLKHEMIERFWGEASPRKFTPFKNGVLELATGKLLPHDPKYRFTWQLPREYSPIPGDWSKINSFLDHLAHRNQDIKNILICYCNAVLKGRYKLQKFLHLIGMGGTGKGAYGRMVTSLIGRGNVHSTTLDEWCHNRFEPANAFGKRLVVFADEDKQVGKIGKFLSLTGQDDLRAEEKNKKAYLYRYEGMVLVMSNLPIFVGDSASRVKRRVITVPCNNPVIDVNVDLEEELESELAAFTNYLLSLEDSYVTKTLKGIKDNSVCTLEFWENRMRVDSIASWINQHVIYDPTAASPVGADKNEGDNGTPVTLFGSYCLYVKRAGGNTTSNKNFSPNVIELCKSVLGWEVERKVTKTGKFIKGLRLRSAGNDDDIPTYDYLLMQKASVESQNNSQQSYEKSGTSTQSASEADSDESPHPSPHPSLPFEESQKSKVSQRGLGGFPHERLANPEGVESQKYPVEDFELSLSTEADLPNIETIDTSVKADVSKDNSPHVEENKPVFEQVTSGDGSGDGWGDSSQPCTGEVLQEVMGESQLSLENTTGVYINPVLDKNKNKTLKIRGITGQWELKYDFGQIYIEVTLTTPQKQKLHRKDYCEFDEELTLKKFKNEVKDTIYDFERRKLLQGKTFEVNVGRFEYRQGIVHKPVCGCKLVLVEAGGKFTFELPDEKEYYSTFDLDEFKIEEPAQ